MSWIHVASCLLAVLFPSPSSKSARAVAPPTEAAERISPIPESERWLYRAILGLSINQAHHSLLPDTTSLTGRKPDVHVDFLREQLYWLFFELVHGQILRRAPPQTRFFVAVPDAHSAPEALGGEEKMFRKYLEQRIGWPQGQIAERVRFFRVPTAVPFVKDIAQALGYDSRGRLVYALGLDCPDPYREALEGIVREFPDEFQLRRFPGLSTEGGDLDLVRLPGGAVGLLVGRNRVRQYIETRYRVSLERTPAEPARIDEAKKAFQRAFGLETIVLGQEALRQPELANSELFHLDMLVAVFRGTAGVVVFVPTYEGAPVDALSHIDLPRVMVARLQAEYDRAAAQMGSLGYRVVRLPYADHPVRSPVNVGKFTDPASHRQFVLLGRYPYHLNLPDGRNPQLQLQLRFQELDQAVVAWVHSHQAPHWKAVQAALRGVWAEMDRAAEMPNPIFDQQRHIYESNGVSVWPIPIYPMGEGGIHCLVLQ